MNPTRPGLALLIGAATVLVSAALACTGGGAAADRSPDRTPQNAEAQGPWRVETPAGFGLALRTDADSSSYSAMRDGSTGPFLGQSVLTFRCRQGELVSAFITTYTQLPRASTIALRRRVGGAPPVLEQWRVADDETNLQTAKPLKLIRELAKSDTLRVEFRTAEGTSETVRFPVGGLASRLRNLIGECGDVLAPDVVWTELDVDTPVSPAAGNKPPRYPETLRARGVEGEVVAAFVVDTSGRVEPTSILVQRASDPAFAEAVTAVLPSYRFVAARVAGRRVRQRTLQPFAFTTR